MKRKVSARANFVSSGTEQHHQPTTYLKFIRLWRRQLRDIATKALQMEGVEDGERDNLKRAIDLLRSIDELVKIIGERPYAHAQAHALGQLWGAIGAAFIIGSRGIENPLTQKFLKDKAAKSAARARSGKRTEEIDKIIARRQAALCDKNPTRAGNPNGIARDIYPDVNSDLAKSGIKRLSQEAIRKRIARL